MRVLAIDCALDACSAAVLDTDTGGIIASETRIMARGHAEAVMPLIARVMDEAEIEFSDLDRIAVTIGPGSFTGSAGRHLGRARHRAWRPASPPSACPRWPASRPRLSRRTTRTPVVAAIDARHDQRLHAGLRQRRAHACGAPRRDAARGRARRDDRARPHRRFGGELAGGGLAARAAAAGAGRAARRARHRLDRAARRRRGGRPRARRSRSICARPTRSRKPPRACRADDGLHRHRLFARAEPMLSEASPRDAAAWPRCTALRSIADGARTNSSGSCSIAQSSPIAP